MSRNSSVAVLADCTDLYNSHVSLMGINGPSSVLSIENETILTNNSDISPNQVIGSVSFLERVQSTDLAALFPRGSLNQIRKKKKKSSESCSLSTSLSSGNISSLQSNINVIESDENVSASFEECSESKEESSKPFNKRLYLKKKSVKISFGSGSLNNSISEKSLKRSSRAVNVSLDPLCSKRRNVKDTDENVSDSDDSKKLEIQEESSKVFSKRSNRKKKSVNVSFDSGPLNSSAAEKSLEGSQIFNVTLPSKRKNASRRQKLNCVLNIDDLETVNSMIKKTKSITSSINISCNQINEETNESMLESAEGNSFNESRPKDNKAMKSKREGSAKVFNKNLYLKKKSINISFDSISLNDSMVEKGLERNSEVVDVSLDSEITNAPESPKNVSKELIILQNTNNNTNENENASYITISNSSKINNIAIIGEEKNVLATENDELSNILACDSLKVINEKQVELDCSKKKSSIRKVKSIPSFNNVSCSEINEGSKESRPISSEENSFSKNTSADIKIIKDNHSSTSSNLLNHGSNSHINSVTSDLEKNDDVLSKNIVKKNLKDGNKEFTEIKNSNDSTINDLCNGNNISKSSEIYNATSIDEERKKTPESDIHSNDSLKTIDEMESAKILNKNLYLKKKSLSASFDSNCLDESMVEKRLERNCQVGNVSLDPSSPKITNVIESEQNISGSFEESQKIDNKEESAKVFNKNLYLKKKSIHISFDSSHLDDPVAEKSLERNRQVDNVSLDPLSPKITNVTESAANVSASFEGSQKIDTEEESTKVFNKNLYLKKKSINISFDSSHLDDPITEKSLERNSQAGYVSLDPLSPKITNVTESEENVSASFEGSQKIDNEEEPAKVFNKNLYLKKKSIPISFDSSQLDDPVAEKSLERNRQVDNVSLDPLSPKITNVTESEENVSASFEGSQKIDNEEESAKVFNKNLYLKKKSINVSFNSTSLNDPVTAKCLEINSRVDTVSSDPFSPTITNATESAANVSASFEGSQKIDTEEESTKVFNKNLYLKKKSINISFDSSHLDDPIADKSLERNSQAGYVSLDPLSHKITNVAESAENVSGSFEGSQKIDTEDESAKVFNKNLYLKKKSINISFDSSHLDDPIAEKSLERNSQVGKASLYPLSPKIKNAIESVENVSMSFEGSQNIDNEGESAKVFNKNLYLKKKSINVSFDSTSLNDPITAKSLEIDSRIDSVSLDPLSSKITNAAEPVENVSAPFEGSLKIEIEKESKDNHSSITENSLHIPAHGSNFHITSAVCDQEQNDEADLSKTPIKKKSKDGNIEMIDAQNRNTVNDYLTGKSDKIHNISTNDSLKAIDEESAKLFNKNLYPEKSINISCSLNDSLVEKNLERNSQVGNVSLDPLFPKITTATESAENVSKGLIILQNSNNNTNGSDIAISNSSKAANVVAIIGEEKNVSATENDKLSNILTSDSLKAINEKAVELDHSEGNSSIRKAKSIPSSINDSCSQIIEGSKESRLIVNENTSKDYKIIKDNHSSISSNLPDYGSNSYINSVGSDREQNDEIVLSKNLVKLNSKDGNTMLIDALNSNETVNDLSSEINNATVVDEEKKKLTTENEMHTQILTNNSSEVIIGREVLKDCSEGNLKSISTSINIPCSQIGEKSNESRPMSVEENCFEEVCFKENMLNEGKHSRKTENSEHCPGGHVSISHLNSEGSDLEQNEQVVVSKAFKSGHSSPTFKKENRNSIKKNKKEEKLDLIDVNGISKGNVTESNISNSSENDNSAIFYEEINKSASENDMHTNILTNDSLKVRDKRAVEQDCVVGNSWRKEAKSISSSNDIFCNKINKGSKEIRPISPEENSFNKNTSEDNKIIKGNRSNITNISERSSNANINSGNSDQEQIEEAILSKSFKAGCSRSTFKKENRNSLKKNQKDKNMELVDGSGISQEKSNECNISSSSKIDKDALVEDEKNKVATENYMRTDVLNSQLTSNCDPSKVIDVQDYSEENPSGSKRVKSIPSSNNIPFSHKYGEFNESQPKLAEENNLNDNTSKGNKTIKDNSKRRTTRVSKKNLDMRMSVGLSVICKDNEGVPEPHSVKNICHSTPLVKYQKNKITSKKRSAPEEINSGSKHVFGCPDIPARNLRERSFNNKSSNTSKVSRKDTRNHSDNLEKSAKKSKTSPSGNGTEDFIKDISIIPNPKPFTRSRVMYHSTPISRTFNKKNRSKIKGSSNIEMENEIIQRDDKMIQVSKSIFGSSTEVTNATVSKKKSIEFSSNSNPYNEKIDNRTKRKSDSHHSGIKKLPKMESITDSRSYHSNFISTLEDNSSYFTTRKSMKRVAFKSISSNENSTSGYGNSSDDYAPRNRKSVGFRDAISLIEDTIGSSSEGDIRDANNSHLSIANPNSIRISDTPRTVNDSKISIGRTDLSLNYSTEIPEIILTENEIECNEMSEECSLFNKLIEMAENKKLGRNKVTRQTKLSRGRKKLGSSNLVISHESHSLRHHEKWVSPSLIKFLNNRLMTDALDHLIKTERIVSILCSAVSAVRNLQDADDIDFALLPLKNILLKFRVCCNMIEYCTFISRFTPFEFQRKALPLEGYFRSIKRGIQKKLTDPILTETEKMNVFL